MAMVLLLAGCDGPGTSTSSPDPSPTVRTTAPEVDPSPRPTARAQSTRKPPPPAATATATKESPARTTARRVLRELSLDEQVGQLLLVGVPATGPSRGMLRQLAGRHIGGIMLTGRSGLGVGATKGIVRDAQVELARHEKPEVRLLIATDQEGGAVQVLSGPGFDNPPTAVEQGRWAVDRLMSRARRWGRQLHAAGVNLNLAPVADIVPRSPDPDTNEPIGRFDRQLGSTTGTVRSHAAAFACGMRAVGVVTAVKHFPGLGHVRGNTDYSARVVDRAIGPRNPGLRVFTEVAKACGSMVMTSTVVYTRLDPRRPAAFSPTVTTSLLRERLGFEGVVVSDDLGNALQVQRWTAGERARMLLSAGADLVLTVQPDDVPAMFAALAAGARENGSTKARVRESALRVLTLKAQLGLIGE
jgi:beta-N-acetylhexosaminidase